MASEGSFRGIEASTVLMLVRTHTELSLSAVHNLELEAGPTLLLCPLPGDAVDSAQHSLGTTGC